MNSRLYINPTPGAGFGTYLLVKGVRTPADMVGDTDIPTLRSVWEQAILDAAAYLLFKDMDWIDEAASSLKALDEAISNTIDILGVQRKSRRVRVKFRGAPRG
jgi:hypothetical protein